MNHLQAIQQHRPMFKEFVTQSRMLHLYMKLNDLQEYYSPAEFQKIFQFQKMEMVNGNLILRFL